MYIYFRFPAWVVHEMRWYVDRTLQLVEKHKAVVAKAVTMGEVMIMMKMFISTLNQLFQPGRPKPIPVQTV